MTGFVSDHRDTCGVEPICQVLQIAPSTYYSHAVREADPESRPHGWWRDWALEVEVCLVWDENKRVYGAKKVWKQLLRDGWQVARCTVERLMRRLGLRGVIRGKPEKTTVGDKAQPCPLDRVNWQFHADRPYALWVSDFTYVSTWQGMVYVAFVVDVYARRRRSWRNREQVELATLDWVHWYNRKRLLEPIGHIPPADAGAAYYRQQASQDKAA